MSASPETRASLLIRLKDQADDEAWFEFTEIYRPVIYRLACRRGMQPADADDLVQQVLTAVARVIDRWEADPERARFRTWLNRGAGWRPCAPTTTPISTRAPSATGPRPTPTDAPSEHAARLSNL